MRSLPRLPLRWFAVAFLSVALGVAACGSSRAGEAADDGRDAVHVVATTAIWADVVASVGCDTRLRVETVVPSGSDPHAFEPSLADRAAMERADLVVTNGLGLEEGIVDTLSAVAGGGTPVFEFGAHVDARSYSSDRQADTHRDRLDPHLWLDPLKTRDALPALADALVVAGLDVDAVERCAAALTEELGEVAAETEKLVSGLLAHHRLLVTNHDSLGYFADRYGFEVIGTVLPTPSGLAEANPGQLEELARVMKRAGVRVIFADTQTASADAEAVARSLNGVRVVLLDTDTLGEPGTDESTYVGMLRTTAAVIVDALSQPDTSQVGS